MGFPSGYTEDMLPKLIIHTLSLLGLIKSSIFTILGLMGLTHLLEPDTPWSEPGPRPEPTSKSASIIRDLLPVMKFADCQAGPGSGLNPPESCAVCLHDFHGDDEIRPLRNCQHIFHKGCVDRWIEHDQKTCPLCRKPLVPHDLMMEAFNHKFWDMVPEFGGEYCPINTCLWL